MLDLTALFDENRRLPLGYFAVYTSFRKATRPLNDLTEFDSQARYSCHLSIFYDPRRGAAIPRSNARTLPERIRPARARSSSF